jgi:L-cysteate sulfo-lyase
MRPNNLIKQPRLQFFNYPTPFYPLKRLSANLGGANIWIKRDDLTPLGAAGNKVRKLEFIMKEAIAQGCDVLITDGALQSNTASLLAASSAKLGLQCELVLKRRVPRKDEAYEKSGNMLLDRLLGAKLHIASGEVDTQDVIAEISDRWQSQGKKAYVVPFGGSTWIGALGYVDCADEIMQQAKSEDLIVNCIAIASGSGGTQSVLVAGFAALNKSVRVIGYDVGATPSLAEKIRILSLEVLSHLAPTIVLSENSVITNDSHLGKGYGIPTDGALEAIKLIARLEGIILDPVYTGKAMAGLINDISTGIFNKKETIVFLHSGGLPDVFAYAPEFYDEF